jgi:hypothetical protein
MVLITNMNIAIFQLKSIKNKERTMPIRNFEKKRLSFSYFRKINTRKVQIILNLLRSYSYGSYSQKEYSKIYIWNLFEVWSERWQIRTSKTNDTAPQIFIKFTRVQCSYFLTKWGPIDMVLIASINKPSFQFEIDLKSRRRSRCDLEMNGTALESIEIVRRVEY